MKTSYGSTSPAQEALSLIEMETICEVFFEGKHQSIEHLKQAGQVLEDKYLPDNPTKEVICTLLTFFNTTNSTTVRLVISERLSYYIQER